MQCLEFGKAALPVYLTFYCSLHSRSFAYECSFPVYTGLEFSHGLLFSIYYLKNKNKVSKIYVGCNKLLFKFPILLKILTT